MTRDEATFPVGSFDRTDPGDDAHFYRPPRLVTHIDDRAITAVGVLSAELGIDGSTPGRRVLDVMSSWVSHFATPPASSSCSGAPNSIVATGRSA